MMEIAKKERNELVSQEDLEFLIWFDEQEKRAKVIRDKIKQVGHDFLVENDLLEEGYVSEVANARVRIYEKKPYKKKQVDTKALKDEGLYDLYTKDVWVKGSTVIQIEYDD